jgi:guanosine-3',5'-bis(diphosphate) 3'-pyrophosphohydrolase
MLGKYPSSKRRLNHPIEVMRILDMVGIRDPVVLAAAVLHDTVEDTETTIDEIRSVFNEDIAVMVSEVTDDRSLAKLDRKLAQIEKMRTVSCGARMIKIADKSGSGKVRFADFEALMLE